MPLIGRLDDQTDAVLIRPLEKRSRHSPEASRDEPAPGGAAEPSPTDRRTPDDKESSTDEPARPRELPVWLL